MVDPFCFVEVEEGGGTSVVEDEGAGDLEARVAWVLIHEPAHRDFIHRLRFLPRVLALAPLFRELQGLVQVLLQLRRREVRCAIE